MRSIIFLVSFLIFSQVWSQNKILTIKDAIAGHHLFPRGPVQLKWLPSGEYFSKVNKTADETLLELHQIESKGLGLTKILTLTDFINSGNEITLDLSNLKAFPNITWINNNEFIFDWQKGTFRYHFYKKKMHKIWDNPDYSDRAFTKNHAASATSDGTTIHLIKEGKTTVITHGKKEGLVIGQTVHRSEFGITNGLFWSPKGSKLAYYVMDESMVTQYPLYQLNDTPATAHMIRYPTAGGVSHHVSIYVTDWDKKKIRIKTKENSDDYLTNVAWTPDETKILIAVVSRNQKEMHLNLYDAQSGDFIKTLFKETNSKYVEPEHPAIFLENEPDKFLWFSERDGYNHLYLYDLNGKLHKQLTTGAWVVNNFHGFGAQNEIFITTTQESPLERHLYCVNLKNGKGKKLTEKGGTHTVILNGNGTYFFDNFSSTTTPLDVSIKTKDGGHFENLIQVENPLAEYKLGEMTIDKIKGNGGHDLYYRIFKPIDFDPNKKYPVVVYLYNGPHLQLINNRWLGGANLWYHYMAQKGYIVYSIDGRGSSNRGFDFESAIHKQCGQMEMEDQISGVEWLKKQLWVDTNRLGVHGWSYGGFMTTSLMTHYPKVFKVGVAGGPVIDWSLYEIMYTERYMESPQTNPVGYQKTNLKNNVQNLEGKLLMIHGGLDDVVLWQHSLQYLQQAIKKGVQLDYFVYPHHEHNVMGMDRVHLYEKISEYFFLHL